MIDIGAYDGDTAKFFRQQFPGATIHCFEPQPKQFQTLQQWAETQGGRVTCHPQALGETNGSAVLQSYPQMPRYASMQSATEAWIAEYSRTRPLQAVPVEIQIRRLDDMARELALVDDILVKVDTEAGCVSWHAHLRASWKCRSSNGFYTRPTSATCSIFLA